MKAFPPAALAAASEQEAFHEWSQHPVKETLAALAKLPSLVVGGEVARDSDDAHRIRTHIMGVLRGEKPVPTMALGGMGEGSQPAGTHQEEGEHDDDEEEK